MAHSRKKKRELSPTSSPTSRSSTPPNTTATRSAANDPSVMLPVVNSNTLVQPASISAAVATTFPVPSGDNAFAAFEVPTLRLLEDCNSSQHKSRPSQPVLPPPSAPSNRDGRTKIYYQGYQLTRANVTGAKISYQCSYYRKPKLCPGRLMFYADTMTYDFANMIPHTCLNPGGVSATAVAADDSVCLNLVDEMKEFVDKMVEETDNGATQIWDEVYKKFYLESNRV
ncbi:hypothetical protein L916_03991, partial [Phytophthora nicotianae]